jgi:hypothetical protein
MPEFLSRPNLPNSLANSLVQLAAHETDPLVAGLNQIGKLADDYSERKDKENLLDKQAKIQDERDQKAHERQMDITRMELAHKDKERQSKLVADLLPLLSKAEAKDMTAADAERLATPGFQGPLKSSGQFQPPKPGEIPGEAVGLPRGYNIKPGAKEKFKVPPKIAKKFGLPEDAMVTVDQVAALHRADALGGGRSGSTPKDADMVLAEKIVEESAGSFLTANGRQMTDQEMTEATLDIEAKIKAHRRGEEVVFDKKKEDAKPTEKSYWDSIKEKISSALSSEKKPDAKPASGSTLPGLKITKKA